MAAFSRTVLAKHLQNLSLSQQKIQKLSEWMVVHKSHYKTIVNIWFKELFKVPENRKLSLLYLANDVIQNTKKKFPDYGKEFGEYLPKVLKHLAALENYEKKFNKDVTRILRIWEHRGVYSKDQMVLLNNALGGNNEEEVAVFDHDTEEFKFEEMEDIFAFSPNSARNIPRKTNEVVKVLQLMKHPASFDAKIRYEIVSLPDEVSNVEVLTNITNKEAGNKLAKKVNYALELTEGYNIRLLAELQDRKKLDVLLKDYTAAQSETQLRAKEKLKKYKVKLVQLRKLRKEIKSHVQKLPDLRRLPVVTGGLGPLPSVGDLFKAKN